MPAQFLELFAGAGGLTAAVQRSGCPTAPAHDIEGERLGPAVVFDILKQSDFNKVAKKIRRREVRWLHLAPPCKSLTKARRRDRFGRAVRLRSSQFPMGVPGTERSKLLKEGNAIARACAKLARLAVKAGAWVSMENPAESFLWELPFMVPIVRLKGMNLTISDMCCFGCTYKKPTGWLTNAEWLRRVVDHRCPGQPAHPAHPPLQGFTTDAQGKSVWLTALAAEYPQGLCERLAQAYADAHQEPFEDIAPVRMELDATRDPLAEPTSKEAREVENEVAIGGLRNPVRAVARIKGWRRLGPQLSAAIQTAMAQEGVDPEQLLSTLGQVDGQEPPEHVIEAVRQAIANVLGIRVGAAQSGQLDADLLEAMVSQAGDPEVHVPAWARSAVPLGVEHPIPTCGIFPTLSRAESAVAAQMYAKPSFMFPDFANYTSYRDNEPEAIAALDKEEKMGFMCKGTRAEMEAKFGPLVPSRIGVIVKWKALVKKTRIIHDLSRSGVNQRIRLPERIVLPRLSDVQDGIARLARAAAPDQPELEFMVLDFSDAFKHLKVHQDRPPYRSEHFVLTPPQAG